MIAFAVVIGLGVAIGYARGGRLSNASGRSLALLPVIWGGLGLQIGAQFVPEHRSMIAYGMVIVSYAAVFAFAGANWRIPGMPLIALGGALNYLVILANQGMPVSAEAVARLGHIGEAASSGIMRGKHILIDQGVRLEFLGDVIPLWRPELVSIGDLVIFAGLMVVVQAVMQPRRHARDTGRTGDRVVIDIRDDVVRQRG